MNRTSLLGPNSTSGIVASVFVPIFVGITLTFSMSLELANDNKWANAENKRKNEFFIKKIFGISIPAKVGMEYAKS